MIELLDRPLLQLLDPPRRAAGPGAGASSHTGPKVTLINGQAGSGGDAFPYYFKKLGLGPLIGTRTWGGLIGISGNPDLIDGAQRSPPPPSASWTRRATGASRTRASRPTSR